LGALTVKAAPRPDNEAARLGELRSYRVLDTPPEQAFDDITALAARVCRRPMALISLIDTDRQWFKSRHGLDLTETPRDVAFCAHAILNPHRVMVVPDALRDARFTDNPLVTRLPHVRSYAGAPLVSPGGEALGTLCVLGPEPAEFSEAELDALRALARQAMAHLEWRRSDVHLLRTELEAARHRIGVLEANADRREEIERTLRAQQAFSQALLERASEGICVGHRIRAWPFVEFTVWNRRMTEITGYTMEAINRIGFYECLVPAPQGRPQMIDRMRRLLSGERRRFQRLEIKRADGSRRTVDVSTSRLPTEDGRRHVLALMQDFTAEEHLQREATLARKDALTGVATRRVFEEDAARLLRLASRTGRPCALGFLDLDHLKEVNDGLGHAEGDRVLAHLGALLGESTRASDIVGRIGGDEFALLLPDTDAAGARVFFDRLHQAVLDAMRAHDWPVGLSVGVVLISGHVPSESDALRHADSLMYQAKQAGRNRIVYGPYPDGAGMAAPRTARRRRYKR